MSCAVVNIADATGIVFSIASVVVKVNAIRLLVMADSLVYPLQFHSLGLEKWRWCRSRR
jgi:hypothetical protein